MSQKRSCRAKSPETCRCKPANDSAPSSLTEETTARKACGKCNRYKLLSDFYTRTNGSLASYCKKCHNKRTLENYYNRLGPAEKDRFDKAQLEKEIRSKGMKTCSRCKNPKPIEEYQTKAGVEKYQFCVACRPDGQREYLASNPEREEQRRSKDKEYRAYVESVTENLKRKGCADCGRYLPHAMEFDHTCPPEEKLYNITSIHLQAGASRNLKQMLQTELAKGEYLCVNCHRKRTIARQLNNRRMNYFKNPNDPSINENAKYIYSILASSNCVDCGNNDFLVLEFDHVRGKKLKDVGRMAAPHSGAAKKEIDNEIAKCDIRCANCHRERTYARSQGHESTLQQPRDKTKARCSCGKKKSRTAVVCLACSKKENMAKVSNRYGKTEKILQELKFSSYVQVAKKYGVSDNALRKHLRKLGFDPKTLLPIDLTSNK